MSSFLIIQERSYSGVVSLEGLPFGRFEEESYFQVFFIRKTIFDFPSKEQDHIFGEKKYHLSWWYKKYHIPVWFCWKDHLFRKFGKRKYGFSCSGKRGPKNQNSPFKLKFGTMTNSNQQNSMVVFAFSVLDWKHRFWAKFGPKNQNCQFKLKFGSYNQFHNILRFFNVLSNFPFTTSETMGNYYL